MLIIVIKIYLFQDIYLFIHSLFNFYKFFNNNKYDYYFPTTTTMIIINEMSITFVINNNLG